MTLVHILQTVVDLVIIVMILLLRSEIKSIKTLFGLMPPRHKASKCQKRPSWSRAPSDEPSQPSS